MTIYFSHDYLASFKWELRAEKWDISQFLVQKEVKIVRQRHHQHPDLHIHIDASLCKNLQTSKIL